MISESEAERIVRDAARRVGMPAPPVTFQPRPISYMPVSYFGQDVAITPAAREALSPEALDFAVVQELARATIDARGHGYRQAGVVLVGLIAGTLASRAGANGLVSALATFGAVAVALAATAFVRARWPSPRIARTVVAALPNLDGARAYAAATDAQNLNRDQPEPWTNAHGALVDLTRLERAAAAARTVA